MKNTYAEDWEAAYCGYCFRQLIRIDGGHKHILYELARDRMGAQAYNALPTHQEYMTARGIRPRNIEVTMYVFEGYIFNMKPEIRTDEIIASDTGCYDCPISTSRCSYYSAQLERKNGFFRSALTAKRSCLANLGAPMAY